MIWGQLLVALLVKGTEVMNDLCQYIDNVTPLIFFFKLEVIELL